MALAYKLVGFDRDTDTLALSYDLPAGKVLRAKTIAGVANNPAIIADWPLSQDQAAAIAELIGTKIEAVNYDWALEPYAFSGSEEVRRPATRNSPHTESRKIGKN
jgi:hypothetical protein